MYIRKRLQGKTRNNYENGLWYDCDIAIWVLLFVYIVAYGHLTSILTISSMII